MMHLYRRYLRWRVLQGYTRKQLDALTDFVKRPQIGARVWSYARVEADGTVKSSVDKFYSQETLQEAGTCDAG